MRRRLAIVACCLSVIAATITVAAVLRPVSMNGAGWRLRFTPGQTFHFSLQCLIAGPHSHTTTLTSMVATVTSVAVDGTAALECNSVETVRTIGRDGIVKHFGPFNVRSRLSMSPNGLTTSPDNTLDTKAANSGAFLPNYEPRTGSTWDLPSPMPGLVAIAWLHTVGVNSRGRRVAEIGSTAVGTRGAAVPKPISFTSTVLFDVDRHIVISRQTTMRLGSPIELATAGRQDLIKPSD